MLVNMTLNYYFNLKSCKPWLVKGNPKIGNAFVLSDDF